MKKSKIVNFTTWAGYITICNVRRIEQDHLFWYIWSGNKLEPEIISKGAGKLTIEEIENPITSRNRETLPVRPGSPPAADDDRQKGGSHG